MNDVIIFEKRKNRSQRLLDGELQRLVKVVISQSQNYLIYIESENMVRKSGKHRENY